jgi:hypothetical protein
MPALFVPRHNDRAEFEAFFSLSQTQRRLAWRYKREALEWERQGHLRNYAHCRSESDRLWRAAWTHLEFARRRYK